MIRTLLAAALVAGSLAVPAAAETPTPSPVADGVRQAEYWLDGYGISEAWKTTRGKGQRIAVIDTGIAKVPEFDGAVVGGIDMSGKGSSDGRTPVGVVDRDHGSWVASLAAGRGKGDGTGLIGVAPDAELLSISVGFGSSAAVPVTQQIAKAVTWAVDNGATVINMSLTTNTLTWDQSWDAAFKYAFEHDVVVVVAAGNRGSGTTTVGAPATIPGVLTVGGVDPQGKASAKASTQGITIGVMAPSEKLLGVSADGTIAVWAGTSGASPIVAGIAALVRASHPGISAGNVINRILKTAKPAVSGSEPDPIYGHGLVDAAAAVTADVPTVRNAEPIDALNAWIKLYRRAEPDPQASPTAAPETEVPPLPAPEPEGSIAVPFLPTPDSLLYGTVPLVGLTLPGILVGIGVMIAVRRVRKARRSRAPVYPTH